MNAVRKGQTLIFLFSCMFMLLNCLPHISELLLFNKGVEEMTHWNAGLYDTKHQFVSKYGEGLLDLLDAKENEVILDLGCGTGDLAQQISLTGAQVVGVDYAVSMVEQAKAKYPHIDFQQMDATKLPFVEAFDGIFTNAALHWIKTPEIVIRNMYNSLKNGGRLVGEMGGHGNIKSIVDATLQAMTELAFDYKDERFPWYFPSVVEYRALLEQAGFTVNYIELYDRPTALEGENGLLNWLNMFSQSIFADLSDSEQQAAHHKVQSILRGSNYSDGIWTADYRRLRFVAIK